ncbi:MAG: hypothetical protein HZB62_03545 [Nitrospirae bacterium]|nr:hypothetical protein [Nitrospirota bacterium]
MAKKIAVIVRDRHAEALRMAIGLSLEDDEVHIYILDCRFDDHNQGINANLAMLNELETRIISNCPDNSFERMHNEAIARELVHYDTVIPY